MAKVDFKNRSTQTILLAVLAAVIGVGAKLTLTGGELLPGIDGAYYWVQVRSILNDFTLAFDDLPLVFWAQSLIALMVGDIPLGVRISDALLPAISAIPIYMMLKKSKSVWLPAVAILVVLLHPIQLYFFTGDFLKNSAAIPVVFFIGWILYNWENASKKRSTIYLLICFLVLGLSHFGTLLMALLLVFIWLVIQLRKKSLRFWLVSAGIALGTIGLVLIGLAVLVPARFTRLFEFVSQPDTVFANPAWQMLLSGRTDYPMLFSIVTGQIGALVLAFLTWKSRKNFSGSHLSLVAASLTSTVILSSPLIGMEWAQRLIALSFVPLFIAAIIIWNSAPKLASKAVISSLAISTLLLSGIFGALGIKQSMITSTQYQALVQFSEEFEVPENSIVVAPHGIEFLVAWLEKTHVLQDSSYTDEDLTSYDHVYALASTGGKDGGYASPPDGAKPDGMKPNGPPPGDMKPSGPPPSDMGKGKEEITGEQVYKNDSYTLKQVR